MVLMFEFGFRIVEVKSSKPSTWEIHQVELMGLDERRTILSKHETEQEAADWLKVLFKAIHDLVIE